MSSHAPITAVTWVAVFDGGRSAVFENLGFDDAPNLRHVLGATDDNPAAHEQGRDKPGRYPTPTGGRAATEVPDPHQKEEDRFVDALAGQLDKAAQGGQFHRLVVIAPAPLIARLRERAPHAAAKIAAERAGDFVHAPVDKIERVFSEAAKAAGAAKP